MSNINVLEQILEELIDLDAVARDKHIKCAISASIIKYTKQIEDEKQKNALRVIEHKISHLVRKLK